MAPDPTVQKTCFVISPIGPDDSEIRRRADRVFKHIITPPCEAHGYAPVRADHITRAGMITTQVVEQILQSDLVIADLTGQNANVFYELAIRHAIHKPYIQLIEAGDTLPFDIAGLRTIHVNSTDLDSVAEARSAIAKQMEDFAQNEAPVESPISTALNLLRLQRSEDPEQRSLATVIETLGEMRAEFGEIAGSVRHVRELTRIVQEVVATTDDLKQRLDPRQSEQEIKSLRRIRQDQILLSISNAERELNALELEDGRDELEVEELKSALQARIENLGWQLTFLAASDTVKPKWKKKPIDTDGPKPPST